MTRCGLKSNLSSGYRVKSLKESAHANMVSGHDPIFYIDYTLEVLTFEGKSVIIDEKGLFFELKR